MTSIPPGEDYTPGFRYNSPVHRATAFFRPARPIPAEYRSNFRNLILDVAWFGVLSGTAMSFITVYATRLGGSNWQIGLLSAVPAIVNLIFTLPAGSFLQRRSVDRTVFWTAVLQRVFYLLLVPLPWLLGPVEQIWTILGITLVMTIPGTYLAVGFNTLFADAVEPEWRSYLVGIRNALSALVTTVVTLISGWILTRLDFPIGYQVVFGIGFLGAAMSTVHLWFVRPFPKGSEHERINQAIGERTQPETLRPSPDAPRSGVGLRFLTRAQNRLQIRFDLLRGSFGRLVGLLFLFHLAQYLAIPVFPLFTVNELHFSDEVIGLGTALFNLTVFLGSTQLARITARWNYQKTTGIGVVLLGLYPALIVVSRTVALYAVTSLVGGLAWALVGGALYNYLVERVPQDDRPPHLAWYNLALNAAILIGSLLGSGIANQIGLGPALLIFALARSLSGLAILRWG